MPVTLAVGRPGTGKTLWMVERVVKDLDAGRDVYTNFYIGDRKYGYMARLCSVQACALNPGMDGLGYHSAENGGHDWESYRFVEKDPLTTYLAKWLGWREGRGFTPDPRVTVLQGWEQVIALRVGRDALGKAHRMGLRRLEAVQAPEGREAPEGAVRWGAAPVCRVADCGGCSKGLTVGLDELNLWAPSRLWQAMDADVLNRWAYIRKDGLDIYATAQHESRVDVVARQVTNDIIVCGVMGGVLGGRNLQLFTRQKWEPTLLTDKGRSGAVDGAKGGGIFGVMDYEFPKPFNQRIADRYDTYEHVQPSGHLAGTGVRAVKGRKAVA